MKSCFIPYQPDSSACVNFVCADDKCTFNSFECLKFDEYYATAPDCFCCENCINNLKD